MQPGAILREAWELYKTHWRTFLPLALVVYILLGLVSLLLAWIFGWFGVLLGALVGIVGVFWLQGALVEAVADVRDGRRDLTMGETFQRVRPSLGTLIVAGILAGIAIAIGLVLFIVPGVFLLVIWCLIVPVIVLEGKGVMESFGRSRELVRGNGWNVFGVIILCLLIWIAVSIVVALLVSFFSDEIRGFLQSLVTNTLVVPFIALALTLMYYALVSRARPAEAPAAAPAPQTPLTPPPGTTQPPTPPTPPEPPPAGG
jgi:ABC-type multidrug transport system fused ATPase/permease subunit